MIQSSEFTGQCITSFNVPASLDYLEDECCWDCLSLSGVTFAGLLCLNIIGSRSFYGRTSIQSLCILASVEILGNDYSCTCSSNLGLRQISRYSFSSCSELKSICITASRLSHNSKGCWRCNAGQNWNPFALRLLGSLPRCCFISCTSLVEVSFELGSKPTRINRNAFTNCTSLPSLVIPVELESIACNVFCSCTSLCELLFDDHSCLKQLDLPPSEFESLCIPDCVEAVSGGIGSRGGQRRLLHFGGKSCSASIELRHAVDLWSTKQNTGTEGDSFLVLSEKILPRFWCQFEGLWLMLTKAVLNSVQ
jgi:hypothetical protein